MVLALFGNRANRAAGQAEEPPGEPSLAEQQELGRIVLEHLRAGDTVRRRLKAAGTGRRNGLRGLRSPNR